MRSEALYKIDKATGKDMGNDNNWDNITTVNTIEAEMRSVAGEPSR